MEPFPSRAVAAERLGLAAVGADVFFAALRASSPDGIATTVTFPNFCEALDSAVGSAKFDASGAFPEQVFALFSSTGRMDGIAVFDEIASGLCVLCAADRDGTMDAIFTHFDTDGNGTLSRRELDRFLVGLFKLMFASDAASMRKVGNDPAQLAERMGAKMFDAADKDESGTIERAEFGEWVRRVVASDSLGVALR